MNHKCRTWSFWLGMPMRMGRFPPCSDWSEEGNRLWYRDTSSDLKRYLGFSPQQKPSYCPIDPDRSYEHYAFRSTLGKSCKIAFHPVWARRFWPDMSQDHGHSAGKWSNYLLTQNPAVGGQGRFRSLQLATPYDDWTLLYLFWWLPLISFGVFECLIEQIFSGRN